MESVTTKRTRKEDLLVILGKRLISSPVLLTEEPRLK